MSELQVILTAMGVILSGLTIAGAGIGAYVAVTNKLSVFDTKISGLDIRVGNVEKMHFDHLKELHYHKGSAD